MVNDLRFLFFDKNERMSCSLRAIGVEVGTEFTQCRLIV